MKEKKNLDRREFLKNSIVGAFGGGVYISSLNSSPLIKTLSEKNKSEVKKEVEVEYRKLGKIDFNVSLLGFGAMITSDPAVLAKALDMGVNYVDTSRGYQRGNNEIMVGKVIKSRRKEVFLTTKTTLKGTNEILSDAEESLRALDTDYIDSYLIKSLGVRANVFDERGLNALEKLKKDGKARYVGTAIHSNEAEVVNAMVDSGFYDLATVKYNFRSDKKLEKALERAHDAGIAVVVMKPMGGRGGKGFDVGYKNRELNHFQAALKWVMNKKFTCSTIPSMTSFQQLNENFNTMGMDLTWSDRKTLYEFARATDKLYCRACDECSGVCPDNVNISKIMRYLMYAEGYGELELGRDSYNSLSFSEQASNCINCDKCVVTCPNKLDIHERMIRAHSLLA